MFIQKEWIEGDPGQPAPPPERKWIRNMVRCRLPLLVVPPRSALNLLYSLAQDWKHMHIEDVLSMPDKWEYPFFAIWDSVHLFPFLSLLSQR